MKHKLIVVLVTLVGVVALAVTRPVAMRYSAASLGFVLNALGAQTDARHAEIAWRTEVANDHDTPMVWLRHAFGAAAYDAYPTNRDANTPYPGGQQR